MKAGAEKQPSSRSLFYGTTVRWAQFSDYVPNGAVYYWNSYAERYEYPCMVSDCSVGYYSSSTHPYCYYTGGNKVHSTSNFQILVNDNSFESLKWQSDSWGKVPPNSINSCSGERVYIGKNQYGLGKVVSKHQAFFLGWKGKEYWYKNYDVLTINKNYKSQHISNVNYDLKQGSYSEGNMVLASSKLINKDCKAVKKITTLSGTVTSEHSWEVGISISQTLTSTITAGILKNFEGSWGISSEKAFHWNKGYTYSESVTYSETIEIEIPPNHSCELVMTGKKMRGQVPFTATATRNYYDEPERSANIQGVSHNVLGLKRNAEVERCVPIPNATPCTA